VRIAPDEISFASPAAARKIFSISKGYHKTEAYTVFPPPENPDIFTEANEAKHAVKRRMVAAAYSMKTMLEMEHVIDANMAVFFGRLEELFVGKRECDLGTWVEYFAFDVGLMTYSSTLLALCSPLNVEHSIDSMDFLGDWPSRLLKGLWLRGKRR
jgi:hypothetical protein